MSIAHVKSSRSTALSCRLRFTWKMQRQSRSMRRSRRISWPTRTPSLRRWSRKQRPRKRRKRTAQKRPWRYLREPRNIRSWNVRWHWMTFTRCGTSIRTSVPRKNTKNFTARYLWITRNRCSGFIWTWIIRSTWKVFCTSRRSTWSTRALRAPSSCTTTRYLSRIISRKLFRSSWCS